MEQKTTKEIFLFSIVAEAFASAQVQIAKKYMSEDQVRQFCTEILERAFKKEGIIP